MNTLKQTRVGVNLIFFIILTIILSTFSSLFSFSSASAADYEDLNISQQARSYAYYRAMDECVSKLNNEIRADAQYDGLRTNPANGYWYGGGDAQNPDDGGFWTGTRKAFVSPYSGNATGERGCSAITNTALNDYWNGVSPADFLTAMNYDWNGVDRWVYKGDNGKSKETRLKDFLNAQGVSIEYTAPTEYFLNYNAFINKCEAEELGLYSGLSDSIKNRIGEFNTPSTAFNDTTVYVNLSVAKSTAVEDYGYTYRFDPDGTVRDRQFQLYQGNFKTCEQMTQNIEKQAQAYLDATHRFACTVQSGNNFAGSALLACIDGIKNSSNPEFCGTKYSQEAQAEACRVGQGQRIEPPSGTGAGVTEPGEESTCAVEGIGWIVCPTMRFMASIADASFDFLADSFLRTDPQVFNVEGPTYQAWMIIRNLANVVFVIVFIIIILSQLTSLGISNYGVKKMLPRLVIAAILVNVSFFISQLAIDLSNILGYSIREVFVGINGQVVGIDEGSLAGLSPFTTGSGFEGLVGSVLVFAAGAGAIYALLSTLAPILLAAVVALIMILFILVARQALIVILVVISPLAFVAFLLPNTEGLFKKWRQALTALLLVFPIIALVFGASALASSILLDVFTAPSTSSVEGAEQTSEQSNIAGQIIAAGILILPLFVIPGLLKKSLDGIPAIGQLANKYSSRANGSVGKRMAESYKNSTFGRGRAIRKQARQTFMDRKFADRVKDGGFRGAFASGIPATEKSRYANESLRRVAQATADKAFNEDVSSMETLFRSKNTDPSRLLSAAGSEFVDASKKGDIVRARAAQNILLNGGGKGIEILSSSISQAFPTVADKNSKVGMSVRNALNAANIKSKHNGMAAWANNSSTLQESITDPGTYSGLNDVELAGQSLASLTAAVAAKAISREQAAAVMRNSTVYKDMEPAKKALFEQLSGPTATGAANPSSNAPPPVPTPPAQTPTGTSPSPQTTGSGPGGLIIPGDEDFKIPRS